MRRVRLRRPGGYRTLEFEETPDPAPGPGEVAVRVHAIGVNYADCIVRMGLYASARKLVGWPITPGFELAGVVAAAGDGVEDLAPGDRVLACTLFGAYTDHAVLPRWQVFPLPESLSFEQGAAFPAVFLTAWYALHQLAHPRPGQHLLVHSAAGGVGGMLVQLGKRAGCCVTGVIGAAHKRAALERLGPDHIVDRSAGDPWGALDRIAPDGFAVIFDANGGRSLAGGWKRLEPGGKLVVYGFHTMLPRRGGIPNPLRLAYDWLRTPRFNPMRMTMENKSVLAFNLSFMEHERELLRAGLEQGLAWLEAGEVAVPGVTTYPFERVADAHRDIESGRTTGKLVLLP